MISLIDTAYKYRIMLLNGLKLTIIVSLASILIGLFFGTIMAFMKISKVRLLRWIANIFVEFIRGTPVLVQIFIVFYGLPMIGIEIPEIMIGGYDFSRLISGTIAMSINTTAYICEIVRGGIQSIELGQTEGALALGMTNFMTMFYVILPQAFKNILPSLGNEFITIIKTSSQISVIGIAELMYVADTIRGISFKPMSPLIIVALMYFAITFIFSILLRILERKLKKGNN